MKFPGVVAVLCVVPSGLVLHIEITSCTFPPWTEMSKKNRYDMIRERSSKSSCLSSLNAIIRGVSSGFMNISAIHIKGPQREQVIHD